MRILVTGAAGFIASHLVDQLLSEGHRVLGLDNFDPYYSVEQKHRNVSEAKKYEDYQLVELDVRDKSALASEFTRFQPEAVVHLAAKAGVRDSIAAPRSYVEVNEGGGLNILECCRDNGGVPLVLSSTSSVYGRSTPTPFDEAAAATRPLSPYAASKRANELMAYTFHDLFQLPVAILRFFTVYGPRGRPDMATYTFSEKLLRGQALEMYGEETERDFTFVEDTVQGVAGAIRWVTAGTPQFGTFNLGRTQTVRVRKYIETLAAELGVTPTINVTTLKPGEAPRTAALVTRAKAAFGYSPRVSIDEGIERWVRWLRESPEAPPALSKLVHAVARPPSGGLPRE